MQLFDKNFKGDFDKIDRKGSIDKNDKEEQTYSTLLTENSESKNEAFEIDDIFEIKVICYISIYLLYYYMIV